MTTINRNYILKGKSGEYYAELLLKKEMFKILNRNFRSKFGEIDIIAYKNNEYYFCEVKTRWNTHFGYPQESVTKTKLERIKKTISYYIYKNNIQNIKYKILIIAQIILKGNINYQKMILFD